MQLKNIYIINRQGSKTGVPTNTILCRHSHQLYDQSIPGIVWKRLLLKHGKPNEEVKIDARMLHIIEVHNQQFHFALEKLLRDCFISIAWQNKLWNDTNYLNE